MSQPNEIRAHLRELTDALVRTRVLLLAQRRVDDSYALDTLLDQTGAMADLLEDAIDAAWLGDPDDAPATGSEASAQESRRPRAHGEA